MKIGRRDGSNSYIYSNGNLHQLFWQNGAQMGTGAELPKKKQEKQMLTISKNNNTKTNNEVRGYKNASKQAKTFTYYIKN